ncbi:MAG: hypothetical protein L0323_01655 [Planctomycetes bacterium]|nr:hypothetical protein [Planctomycetota bacterium]
MKPVRLATFAALLAFAPAATGQVCAPLLPSGQPGLVIAAPLCGPALLPPPVVWAAGNPAFSVVVPPLPMAPFSPVILVLGLAAPPVAIPAPPLDPAFGLPGLVTSALATSFVLSVVPPGPGPVLFALPIPPTGGPVPAISVQAAFLSPALLIGVTGSTAISI